MESSVIRGTYSGYTPENRPKIGMYKTKNSPATAAMYIAVPESRKQQQDSSPS